MESFEIPEHLSSIWREFLYPSTGMSTAPTRNDTEVMGRRANATLRHSVGATRHQALGCDEAGWVHIDNFLEYEFARRDYSHRGTYDCNDPSTH